MKIYDKPVLDARKSTYQKLLHSKLLNSNEVNVGYWKSAIYNYAFLRFLISYCEDLQLFGGTKKFGEVCDVLTVANVVAEIQNSGRANDFSTEAKRFIEKLTIATDRDAYALSRLVPQKMGIKGDQLFIDYRRREKDLAFSALNTYGGWKKKEIVELQTSIALFLQTQLFAANPDLNDEIYQIAWFILQLAPVALFVCLLMAKNERPRDEDDINAFKKLGNILRTASERCFRWDAITNPMPQVDYYSFILKEGKPKVSHPLYIRKPHSPRAVSWDTRKERNKFEKSAIIAVEKAPTTGHCFDILLEKLEISIGGWLINSNHEREWIDKIFQVDKALNWMVFDQITGSLFLLDYFAYPNSLSAPNEMWNGIRGSRMSSILRAAELNFPGFSLDRFLSQSANGEDTVLKMLSKCIVGLSRSHCEAALQDSPFSSSEKQYFETMLDVYSSQIWKDIEYRRNRPTASWRHDAVTP